MKLKFYVDESGHPHFYQHNVADEEIIEFFHSITYFEEKRPDNSWVAYGKLRNQRYLKTIFRKISASEYFIITAYDIENPDIIRFLEDHYESNR